MRSLFLEPAVRIPKDAPANKKIRTPLGATFLRILKQARQKMTEMKDRIAGKRKEIKNEYRKAKPTMFLVAYFRGVQENINVQRNGNQNIGKEMKRNKKQRKTKKHNIKGDDRKGKNPQSLLPSMAHTEMSDIYSYILGSTFNCSALPAAGCWLLSVCCMLLHCNTDFTYIL